jgi:predicted secreted hydrolase
MKFRLTLLSIIFFVTTFCNAQDWKTYPYNPPGSQIFFSADEGHHNSEPIEWWYTAGHLTGETTGKSYSYMLTYFYYPVSVFDGFRILNITDDETGTFYQDTQPLTYATLSTTELDIEASMFFGGTEIWTNKIDNANVNIPFEYTLFAFASFGSLNLEYETLKRPLILGNDGYLNLGENSHSYYYSQTHNDVQGSFTLNGVTENVTGTAWIDRQYGNFNPFNSEKYEWFSMQLSNGMDINLWNIFTPERTIPNNERYRILSSYVNESTQYTSSDFLIERLAFNWMPDENMCYSKQWRLTSTTNNLDLIISTLHDNTEVQLPFRFFEGSTTITGTINGVEVTGIGFAELLHSYENPEITILSPSGGSYDTSMPITWQLNNPDAGRPIFYDLEYSNDNQQNFIPIIQGLTDTSYIWDGSGLAENDEVWFKIIAYSIDGVLNNTFISDSSSTTSLSINQSNDLGIELYPNPASDRLFLKIPESNLNASIQIIDLSGKVVLNLEMIEISNSISVKFLKSGIYFLSIENETGRSILKFVKK